MTKEEIKQALSEGDHIACTDEELDTTKLATITCPNGCIGWYCQQWESAISIIDNTSNTE